MQSDNSNVHVSPNSLSPGLPTALDRFGMASRIAAQLSAQFQDVADQWRMSGPLHHFYIDDLLPPDWANRISDAFPATETMSLKKSLREKKYVAAQMDKYDPLLEETIYAFQDPRVVAVIERITALKDLQPDNLLYAGGISTMVQGHFLNPHVDNSHDKFRERYRVLNLLYYVSPHWELEFGGNLEVWPNGPTGRPTTIVSKFNRLAVMVTDRQSWHSVSRIRPDRSRHCVSNYYFSVHPVGEQEYFHITSFRGRPEQPLRDLLLKMDIALRGFLRRLFPRGVRDNPHYYRKDP